MSKDIDEIREQLEEFAIGKLRSGTTKGRHRTGVFDTLELAKLVQDLITKARIDELRTYLSNLPDVDSTEVWLKTRLSILEAQLKEQTNE